MSRHAAIAAFVLLLAAGCRAGAPGDGGDLFAFELASLDGRRVAFTAMADRRASTFVFLAPDCPLSQNYTLTLNELAARFAGEAADLYAVIPGGRFAAAEVAAFVETYALRLPVLLDPDFRLADFFDAQITPEAFTVDATGTLVYRGAIDNWAAALGRHRQVITERYLADVLARLVRGEPAPFTATRAVGCYIERR